MVSVKSSFWDSDKWLAFPGFSILFVEFLDKSPIRFLVNKPGLEYSFAVLDTKCPEGDLARRSRLAYPLLSDFQFGRYTIISVGEQRKVKRRLNSCGVYIRSNYLDRLDDLRWASAGYRWANYIDKVVDSMESPILIFDSNRVNDIIGYWCSAFVSFLSFGFIKVSVSYGSFSLGEVPFKCCDLLEN